MWLYHKGDSCSTGVKVVEARSKHYPGGKMRRERAVVFSGNRHTQVEHCIERILEFFGLAWTSWRTQEFVDYPLGEETRSEQLRLFLSIESFGDLVEIMSSSADARSLWREHVHSAFVYGSNDPAMLRHIVSKVTKGRANLAEEPNLACEFSVSDRWNEFCGPMSGLTVSAKQAAPVLTGIDTSLRMTRLISNAEGSVFMKMEHEGVPFFLSTANSLVDLDSSITTHQFDLREHFLSAVPIIMYVRWAFPESSCKQLECSACLIIDDPPLKVSYGFLNLRKLSDVALRHNFSASIAFIPWNWSRSTRKVIDLFKQYPKRLSLSVHGCDHTTSEFGTRDKSTLVRKVKKAISRMQSHEEKNGLPYDRIMVFPQGVFSENALQVLKEQNFVAAVNTSVRSTDPEPRKITLASCWDVALMDYGDFPLLTRRYPSEGIENFAFDILLGKPCLVVIHHDFCRDNYAHLTKFIDQLNGLPCTLSWRSLGEVVRRSFRQRTLPSGTIAVEMYGGELRLSNTFSATQNFSIRRRERDSNAVKEVVSDSGIVDWSHADGYITFSLELNPKESALIRITYRETVSPAPEDETALYRLKTAARRHLCEARDNYLQPALNVLGVLR